MKQAGEDGSDSGSQMTSKKACGRAVFLLLMFIPVSRENCFSLFIWGRCQRDLICILEEIRVNTREQELSCLPYFWKLAGLFLVVLVQGTNEALGVSSVHSVLWDSVGKRFLKEFWIYFSLNCFEAPWNLWLKSFIMIAFTSETPDSFGLRICLWMKINN